MINDLFSGLKKEKKKKVRGRGIGCGKGKTSGKGHKGQKSRSGISVKGFEGGQQSILTRLPKRGFNSLRSKNYSVVTLDNIERFILAGKIISGIFITKDNLFDVGLLSSSSEKVKIIGKCRTEIKVKVDYDFISSGARAYVDILEEKV